MIVVDSRKEMLPPPKIIAIGVQQQNHSDVPYAKVMAMVAADMAMEDADMAQIGNTVFIGHIKEGKMMGRAFNVDTARNFVQNILKYHAHLRRRNVEWYVTSFTGDKYIPVFKMVERSIQGTDTQMQLGRNKNTGDHVVVFKLGDASVVGE
jgi:hypothetical protein